MTININQHKPKILFYGNCQIGAISGIFQSYPSLKDKFTVLDAADYNLINQNSYPAVANFLLQEETANGKNDPRDIEKIFSDADIVVFQAINNNTVPEYCLTKNIIPNFDGLSICISSFWYGGYFGWPYKFPMLDLFYYFNKLDLSNKEALNLLLNEPISITEKLFAYYHDFSIEGLKSRSKEQAEIYNYIPILDWLQDTHKNKLLCYNQSHPTPVFFEFIVNEILNRIDSSMEDVNLENFYFEHARANGWFNPTTFKFFNNLFPNLEPLSKIEVAHYHGVYKKDEVERFINDGMKYVKDNEVINGHGLISSLEVKTILGVKD